MRGGWNCTPGSIPTACRWTWARTRCGCCPACPATARPASTAPGPTGSARPPGASCWTRGCPRCGPGWAAWWPRSRRAMPSMPSTSTTISITKPPIRAWTTHRPSPPTAAASRTRATGAATAPGCWCRGCRSNCAPPAPGCASGSAPQASGATGPTIRAAPDTQAGGTQLRRGLRRYAPVGARWPGGRHRAPGVLALRAAGGGLRHHRALVGGRGAGLARRAAPHRHGALQGGAAHGPGARLGRGGRGAGNPPPDRPQRIHARHPRQRAVPPRLPAGSRGRGRRGLPAAALGARAPEAASCGRRGRAQPCCSSARGVDARERVPAAASLSPGSRKLATVPTSSRARWLRAAAAAAISSTRAALCWVERSMSFTASLIWPTPWLCSWLAAVISPTSCDSPLDRLHHARHGLAGAAPPARCLRPRGPCWRRPGP